MADEDDAADGQRAAPAVRRVGLHERQVVAGEDADDAGLGRRGAAVDPDDAGVGVGAQDQARVEHAGQTKVAGVACRPRRLLAAVEARYRLADRRDAGHSGDSTPSRRAPVSAAVAYLPRAAWFPSSPGPGNVASDPTEWAQVGR